MKETLQSAMDKVIEEVGKLIDLYMVVQRQHVETYAKINELGKRLDKIEKRYHTDDILPEHKGRME